MTAIIEADHLTIRFGPVTAVNDVSLAVEQGGDLRVPGAEWVGEDDASSRRCAGC